MCKLMRKKIIVILAVVIYCSTAFSEQSASADAKFIDRIVRKQAELTQMQQGSEELRMAFRNFVEKEEVSKEISEAIEKANTLSGSKYMDRLENKLTSIIKDSIKDVDSMQIFMPSPALIGTVTPESQDKLKCFEKESEKKE